MKRMLTMAAAAAVLCTTLCGGLSLGASAADEQAPAPMKLRLMQGFSYEGKAVGDDIGVSGEYKVQVNGRRRQNCRIPGGARRGQCGDL